MLLIVMAILLATLMYGLIRKSRFECERAFIAVLVILKTSDTLDDACKRVDSVVLQMLGNGFLRESRKEHLIIAIVSMLKASETLDDAYTQIERLAKAEGVKWSEKK